MDWNVICWESSACKPDGLPLYEGVDWNLRWQIGIRYAVGLPLYEGVDWNWAVERISGIPAVSLFTREWIEIIRKSGEVKARSSPSLRGSGLKLKYIYSIAKDGCLPLYEGVDWNHAAFIISLMLYRLPLYEGVDWNGLVFMPEMPPEMSPSLRGSGLKFTQMAQTASFL